MNNNPFVGPKPLKQGDPLFGRKRETAELRYLLSAERIVLLYSPSGAGKSSLVAAGLIPDIEERFDVWPVLRIGEQPPEGSTWNRYVWNAANAIGQAESAPSPLAECVARRERKHRNILLVFDQFEEFLRFDPTGIEAKQQFIDELADLLRDPTVWALFMLREDYLAQIDPWALRLPTRLKNRYRIDLLDCDHAAEAITELAATQQVTFEPGVVDTLVNDLSAGTGLYVEPLALQVVCQRMWDELPDTNVITAAAAKNYGDPTTALSEYYAKQIREVCKGGLNKAEVRNWFQHKLITADRVRRQLMVKGSSVEGLDIETVRALETAHLLRKDTRSGVDWYELAHDRLIDPIRASNEQSLTPEQKQAALWNEQNHPATLLLRGSALRKAARTPDTADFLNASRKAANRRLALYATIASVMLIVTALAIWARVQQSRALAAQATATSNEDAARMAGQHAKRDRQRALEAQGKAETSRAETEAAQITSDSQRIAATALLERSGHTDLAALLGIEAGRRASTYEARNALMILFQTSPRLVAQLHTDQAAARFWISPNGKLMAVRDVEDAFRICDLETLQPRPFRVSAPGVQSFAFSQDSQQFGVMDRDTTLHVFRADNGKQVERRPWVGDNPYGTLGPGLEIVHLDNRKQELAIQPFRGSALTAPGCRRASIGFLFSRDGSRVACVASNVLQGYRTANGAQTDLAAWLGSDSGEQIEYAQFLPGEGIAATLRRYDGEYLLRYRRKESEKVVIVPLGGVRPTALATSPDGQRIATGDDSGEIRFWEKPSNEAQLRFPAHPGRVSRMEFIAGSLLVSQGPDGLKVWNTGESEPLGERINSDISPTVRLHLAARADGHEIAHVATANLCRTTLPARAETCMEIYRTAAIAYSPVGGAIAVIATDANVRVWQQGQKTWHDLNDAAREFLPSTMQFTPDGRGIVVAAHENFPAVYDALKPGRSRPLPGPPGVRAQDMDGSISIANSGLFAQSCFTGSVCLWTPGRTAGAMRIHAFSGKVTALALSPDANFLAAGDANGSVRLWDLRTHAPTVTLNGHTSEVLALQFSRNADMLASGSNDGTVRMWETATPRPFGLPMGSFSPPAFTFLGDHSLAVWIGSNDAIYDLRPEKMKDRVCRVANRNLTIEEWRQYVSPTLPYATTCPQFPPGR